MTALAGVAHLRGGAPPRGLLSELLDTFDRAPGERPARIEAGAAHLGCLTAAPEAAVARSGSVTIVAAGHLHPRSGTGTRTPAEQALAAYERGGVELGRELGGHFALALWDEHAARLLLVRDPAGVRPLFFARDGDLLVWSSSVRALIDARPALRQIDERSLAAHLAMVEPADLTRTAWEPVKRLPAEHRLLAVRGSARVERYSDLLAPPRDADPAVAPGCLRELLEQAGERAVMGEDTAVVAMSGGMDSTSVAATTGERGAARLRLLSMGYRDFPELDESRLIDLVVGRLGYEHEYVYIDDAWPLADWPESYSAPGDLPPHFGTGAWSRVAARARELGGAVLLTGHGGDGVLAYSPLHHVELFRGPLPAAVRELRAYRRSHGAWPAGELRAAGMHALRRHLPWLWTAPPTSPLTRDDALLRPEFVARSGVVDDMRAQVRMFGRAVGRETLLRLSFSHSQQRVLELMDEISRAAGVEMRHPFLDATVLAYAAALPERAVFRGGVRKRVLRDAMRGRLPDEVRRSFRAVTVTGQQRRGLGPEGRGAEVREVFRDPLLARLGYIRPEPLRDAYESFLAGDGRRLGAVSRTLGAELWLRHKLGEPLPGG